MNNKETRSSQMLNAQIYAQSLQTHALVCGRPIVIESERGAKPGSRWFNYDPGKRARGGMQDA